MKRLQMSADRGGIGPRVGSGYGPVRTGLAQRMIQPPTRTRDRNAPRRGRDGRDRTRDIGAAPRRMVASGGGTAAATRGAGSRHLDNSLPDGPQRRMIAGSARQPTDAGAGGGGAASETRRSAQPLRLPEPPSVRTRKPRRPQTAPPAGRARRRCGDDHRGARWPQAASRRGGRAADGWQGPRRRRRRRSRSCAGGTIRRGSSRAQARITLVPSRAGLPPSLMSAGRVGRLPRGRRRG